MPKLDFPGVVLTLIGTAEMYGGRRMLDHVPEGWVQKSSVEQEKTIRDLPKGCTQGSWLLSSVNGRYHLAEADTDFWMYFRASRRYSKIRAVGGLEEILRSLDKGDCLVYEDDT